MVAWLQAGISKLDFVTRIIMRHFEFKGSEFLTKFRAGEPLRRSHMMDYRTFQEYETHLQNNDLSPSTISFYQSDLRQFEEWVKLDTGEELEIDAITPLDITTWRRDMLREGKRPRTINRRLISVSKFFAFCVESNRLPDNPASKIKQVAEEQLAPKSLSRKEQLALVRAASRFSKPQHKARDYAIISLMMQTGLRVGEVANLKLDDLTITQDKAVVTVKEGKGIKSRTVPLNSTAVKALKSHFDSRRKNPDWVVSEPTSDGVTEHVFYGQKRKPLGARGISYMIKRYAYFAKLGDVHCHSLRHTCAKNLIDAGNPIDRVAKILGHSNVNTTMRYTMPTERDLAKMMDTIAWE